MEEFFSDEEQEDYRRTLAVDADNLSKVKKKPLSEAYASGNGSKGKKPVPPPPGHLLPSLMHPTPKGMPTVQGVPEAPMRAAYAGRLLRDLEDRVLSDPDYDPQRFKHTAELLQKLASERGSSVVVEHPEEDIYS